jgi:hypothetical protein
MDEQDNSMKVGDLIRFINTGCHGVVVQSVRPSPSEDRGWIYVLCGPDADGLRSQPTAFPMGYLARVAEVISENR